jgi:hypothetical protein
MPNRICKIVDLRSWMILPSALCLIAFLIAAPGTAAEQQTTPIRTQASETAGRSDPAEEENRQAKRRVAMAALYLVVGIAFVGVALVGLVTVLGHRIRRIARKPLPRQSATDEFWYLRPKKEIKKSQASEPPGSDADGEETRTP